MTLPSIVISGKDIHGLDVIRQAVIECERLEAEEVGKRYALVGNILQENVSKLELDEDINHLIGFARCVGCELLSPEVSCKTFPDGCWSGDIRQKIMPYFYIKANGSNRSVSVVMPLEKQKIGMAGVAIATMHIDPILALGAKKLIQYEDENGLWTKEDAQLLFA